MSAKRYWVYLAKNIPIAGPFDSLAIAENWLREDSADTFNASEIPLNELDAKTWADPALILQEVKTVRPVPVVKVSIKLERVDE